MNSYQNILTSHQDIKRTQRKFRNMASSLTITLLLLLTTLTLIECYPRSNFNHRHRISRRSPHLGTNTKELGNKLIASINNLKGPITKGKNGGITTLSRGTSCFPTGKMVEKCTVKLINGALKTVCKMVPEIVCP